MPTTLAVIPTFVRSEDELEVTKKTLSTLREVEPDLDVYVVDDHSPDVSYWRDVEDCARDLGMYTKRKTENTGYSRTVNVGLNAALGNRQHCVTLNADMEFHMPFVQRMVDCKDSQDREAAVVGALLLYPNGLIQHAGVYFSLLARHFDHRYRYGPGGLPEAHLPRICPVTGAMQFIRYSTLEKVGVYDESFSMAHEDMDYCLRVFAAGLECVYDPGIRAVHHESLFRRSGQEDRHRDSWARLVDKHGKTGLGRFVPEIA